MKTTHKIILGDALKVLKTIPDNSVDLVFADPPYNMSKKNGLAWKYSKHVTMQKVGICSLKMNILNLIKNG